MRNPIGSACFYSDIFCCCAVSIFYWNATFLLAQDRFLRIRIENPLKKQSIPETRPGGRILA